MERTLGTRKLEFAHHEYAPAPGFRDRGDGTLYAVGSDGYSWSAALPTEEFSAKNLGFNNNGIYPNSNSSRAFGLPLRCLQE